MGLKFEDIQIPDYEKVVKVTDAESGLVAIIAIHNLALGPALGGTRIYPYDTFDDALHDVLRLSKGMTYKSAAADVGLGGGKSVIMIDKKRGKTPEILHAFGRAVDSFKGNYVCAEDVGCSTEDVAVIRETTKYVVGLKHDKSSGNPSPYTAWGTFRGVQAVCQKLYGSPSVEGKRVAIQGLGSVGSVLADLLFWHGAQLIVSDRDVEKAKRIAHLYGAEVVSPEEILEVECDILSPCALGGIINSDTIDKFQCNGIAGAANNQLHDDHYGLKLRQRGILYAPDFVINAGGLINVSCEVDPKGYHPKVSRDRTNKIFDKLIMIFNIAEQNYCSTQEAAVQLVDYRLKYGLGKRDRSLMIHHAAR